MYTVYLDDNLIYNPNNEDLAILDPVLTLELNTAGSFVFTMPAMHPYYDSPILMLSRVEVYRDNDLIFRGRITDQTVDFWKRKKVTCEGELAYLNDTIQPAAEYHDMTVRSYLETLISIHNNQVENDKKFSVGIITVTDSNDSLYRYTNFNSTLEEIKEDLIDDLGGYLRVRYSNDVRYLDYIRLDDYGNTNDQAIRFGTNLLDFTEDMDVTDIATVVIPLGERLEESPIGALDMRLTIEDVNGGKNYVQSDEGVATYGRITKTVVWDDVTVAENLLQKGKQYLSDIQWDDVKLTATAIDMSLTDAEMDTFALGDQLRVVSVPHGLNKYFPLSQMQLYLLEPSRNTYTLGITVSASLIGTLITQNDLTTQLGSLSAKTSSRTADAIANASSEVLDSAKQTATDLITAATTSGHVVIESPYEEILIMDTDDKSTAKRVWRWNVNGLGYSTTGYNGTYGLAMTMDGAIVADYITTGTMYADRIKGGTLTLGGSSNGYGQMSILNSSGSEVGSWNRNGIKATAGTIGGWVLTSGKIYNDLDNYGKSAVMQSPSSSNTWVFAAGGTSHSSYSDCPFRVSKDGVLYATDAHITGAVTATSGTFSGTLSGATGSFNGAVYSQSSNPNYAVAVDGWVYLYYLEKEIGSLRTLLYNSTYSGILLDISGGTYGGFTTNNTLQYVLNNGADIFGSYRHYFSGTVRFGSNINVYDHNIYLDSGSVAYLTSTTYSGATGVSCGRAFYCNGPLGCSGTKSRIVDTDHYDSIMMFSYETASPMFGDMGSGVIGDDGQTAIFLDPEFLEVVDPNSGYLTFLTQTSALKVEYADKQSDFFVVYGEAGATFDWQAHAWQRDYAQTRFESADIKKDDYVDFDESIFYSDDSAISILDNAIEKYEKEVDLLRC